MVTEVKANNLNLPESIDLHYSVDTSVSIVYSL